jgi:hypothetical protein
MLGQIFYSAGNALSSGGSEPPKRSERVITYEIKEGGSAALFRNGARVGAGEKFEGYTRTMTFPTI